MLLPILFFQLLLFPLCVSAKTTVKEWTEEDNNKTQPMISVSLKFGQTVTNKIVSKTVTGNIKENDEAVLKMLNFYKKEFNEARERYLKMCGPVYICQQTEPFMWNDEPFPWEKK